MSGIQIAEAKAPWVMFERRGVEDRAATIAEGRYVAKDVDYVLVTPHGSKDQFEIVAEEWFAAKERDVREGRFSGEWLKAYKRGYAEWKEGREIPLEGTPVINWPVLSPAQVRMLQDLHVLTVEVLANANEELIKRLGMGGRALVQKAKDFLAQTDKGKVAEEMGAMRARLEALELQNASLQQQNAALAAAVPAGQAQQPAGGQGIGSGDLFDTDTPAPTGLRKL